MIQRHVSRKNATRYGGVVSDFFRPTRGGTLSQQNTIERILPPPSPLPPPSLRKRNEMLLSRSGYALAKCDQDHFVMQRGVGESFVLQIGGKRDKPIFSQPVGFPAKCHQIGARWVGGEHNKLKSKIFQSQHKSRGSKRKTLNPNRRPNPKPKYQTTNSSPIPKLEHRKPTPDTKSTNPNPNHQP